MTRKDLAAKMLALFKELPGSATERMEAALRLAENELISASGGGEEAVRAERDRLIEALTPSGETKVDYIGEFKFVESLIDQTRVTPPPTEPTK